MRSLRTCGGSEATTWAVCACSDASRLNGRSQRSMSGVIRGNDMPGARSEGDEDGEWKMEEGADYAIHHPRSSIFAVCAAWKLRQRNRLPRLHAVGVDLRVGRRDGLPLVTVAVLRLRDRPE